MNVAKLRNEMWAEYERLGEAYPGIRSSCRRAAAAWAPGNGAERREALSSGADLTKLCDAVTGTVAILDRGTENGVPTDVPYRPIRRNGLESDFGYFDLKRHPEFMSEIFELRNRPELQALVNEINSRDSFFRSVGCAIEYGENLKPGFRWTSSAGIQIVFECLRLNSTDNSDQLLASFRQSAAGLTAGLTAGPGPTDICFSRKGISFHGDDKTRVSTMIRIAGHGSTLEEAGGRFSLGSSRLKEFFHAESNRCLPYLRNSGEKTVTDWARENMR